MADQISELIEAWDGIAVVVRHDRPTGTWIFVALHDDTLGRPTGGCRMKTYDTPADGLRDALRLAAGMTDKWASTGLAYGGGKSVLAVPRPMQGEERRGLLLRFGSLLETLKGAYGTGEDMGITPKDMAVIAEVSSCVTGPDPSVSEDRDPGPYTALGVFSGIRSALRHRFGSDDLAGRTVLIQGVGDVGRPLARHLSQAGASLLLSDLNEAVVEEMAAETGGRIVDGDQVYSAECDVYAPCAIGGTVNPETIPSLNCAIVAGSANNQLENPSDAIALQERGILYAPDYVINSGGAMGFGLVEEGIDDPAEIRSRVATIADSLTEIFQEAQEAGESPLAAAKRRVQRVLAEAGAG